MDVNIKKSNNQAGNNNTKMRRYNTRWKRVNPNEEKRERLCKPPATGQTNIKTGDK
jgi:hypothetical protein